MVVICFPVVEQPSACTAVGLSPSIQQAMTQRATRLVYNSPVLSLGVKLNFRQQATSTVPQSQDTIFTLMMTASSENRVSLSCWSVVMLTQVSPT